MAESRVIIEDLVENLHTFLLPLIYSFFDVIETLSSYLWYFLIFFAVLVLILQAIKFFKENATRNKPNPGEYVTRALIVLLLVLGAFGLQNHIDNIYIVNEGYFYFEMLPDFMENPCSNTNFLGNAFCENLNKFEKWVFDFTAFLYNLVVQILFTIAHHLIGIFFLVLGIISYFMLFINLLNYFDKKWRGKINTTSASDFMIFVVIFTLFFVMNSLIGTTSLEYYPKLGSVYEVSTLLFLQLLYMVVYILFILQLLINILAINLKLFQGFFTFKFKNVLRHYLFVFLSLMIIYQKTILFDPTNDFWNVAISLFLMSIILMMSFMFGFPEVKRSTSILKEHTKDFFRS